MTIKITAGNEKRAEIRVEGLRPDVVKFRAKFDAQCAVEARLGLGIIELLDRVSKHDARFRELAAVLDEFSAAAGTPLSSTEIETLVVDDFKNAWAIFTECLVSIFGKAKKTAEVSDPGKAEAPPA